MTTTIIGVDFSGAQGELKSDTWIAKGRLTDNGLSLDSAHPIRRDDLYDLLADVETPAVAAMDFPFGVPAAFAGYLGVAIPEGMPAVWEAVTDATWESFKAARDAFVAAGFPEQAIYCCTGEPMREGDAIYHPRPRSYSPLHRAKPDMLPMTYRGIGLLHRLHQENPLRWHVPPLEPGDAALGIVTLLELMPGAFLRSIGLPSRDYKEGQQALELRTQILNNLGAESGVALHCPNSVSLACRANHDCLDSVIAAVGAAMWAQDSDRFRHPNAAELAAAQLEGWIYVPTLPAPPQRPNQPNR